MNDHTPWHHRHSHTEHADWPADYHGGELEPRRPRLRKLKVIAVVVGGLSISACTFVTVAAYELATSRQAALMAQAARDSSHAAALATATRAKCDLLVSKAEAAGQSPPPCAERKKDVKESEANVVAGLVDLIVEVALD